MEAVCSGGGVLYWGAEGIGVSKWMRWMPLVVLLAAVGATVMFSLGQHEKAEVGRPAPAFSLPSMNGGTIDLRDLSGRVVFLNLWASWCIPCRDETPALETFYRRYGHKVAQVGINVKEPLDTVEKFVREFGTTYPIVRDSDGRVTRRYGLRAVPETWFLDEQGIARFYWQGPLSFEEMQKAYQKATGRSIDDPGVGPVAPGERLVSFAVLDEGKGGNRSWYMGTSKGLFVREGDSKTWGEVTPPTAMGRHTLDEIASFVPISDEKLLVATRSGELWTIGPRKSLRRVATSGLPDQPLRLSGSGPESETTLYATTADGQLFTSGTDPSQWTRLGYLPQDAGSSAIASLTPLPSPAPLPGSRAIPSQDAAPLVATGRAGVRTSYDSGLTWKRTSMRQAINDLAVLHDAARRPVLLFATDEGIWFSRDEAKTAHRLAGSPARQLITLDVRQKSAESITLYSGAPNGDVYVASLSLKTSEPSGRWELVHP